MDIEIYRRPSIEHRTECAVCRTLLPGPLIDLPKLPLTDILVREKVKPVGYVDQAFHLCKTCGHGQLSTLVDPQVLYGEAYAMRTSQSSGARVANDAFLSFIRKEIGNGYFKTIIEVGCNDTYLLTQLRDRAEHLIGVDPVLKGRESEMSNGNISVIGDFFENADIPSLHNALVITSHLLEHLRDPRAFLEKLLEKADDSTLFIFQFPTLEPLVNDLRFDQIYHHHLHYFSKASFAYLLNRLGCEIVASEVDTRFWGSLLVAFMRTPNPMPFPDEPIPMWRIQEALMIFNGRMHATAHHLDCLRRSDERLVAYGAGLQLPVLAYHLQTDFSSFECVVDDDPQKKGMYYLNLPVPVREMKDVSRWEEVNVLITAIGFSRQILTKLIPLNPRRIIVPLDI